MSPTSRASSREPICRRSRHRAGDALPDQGGSIDAGTLRADMHEQPIGEPCQRFRVLTQVTGTLGGRPGEHEILQQTAILRHANPSDECREPRVSA